MILVISRGASLIFSPQIYKFWFRKFITWTDLIKSVLSNRYTIKFHYNYLNQIWWSRNWEQKIVYRETTLLIDPQSATSIRKDTRFVTYFIPVEPAPSTLPIARMFFKWKPHHIAFPISLMFFKWNAIEPLALCMRKENKTKLFKVSDNISAIGLDAFPRLQAICIPNFIEIGSAVTTWLSNKNPNLRIY